MVERFRSAGSLSKLRSDNLGYMIGRLIQSRPEVNAHRQRRALRMLGVAMETYSRNELTEEEALRVIRDAMHITDEESPELLFELYASILKRTGNGLSFQLASYGEYLAAEELEDASFVRLKELAFLDAFTPNDSWGSAVSYLVELDHPPRVETAKCNLPLHYRPPCAKAEGFRPLPPCLSHLCLCSSRRLQSWETATHRQATRGCSVPPPLRRLRPASFPLFRLQNRAVRGKT